MTAVQNEIERRGSRIFELVDKHPEPLFSKAGLYQRLMALSMRDEQFKVQLFRFVDVLPSLRGSSEIIEHLDEYFSDNGFGPLVDAGVRLARIVPWVSGPLLRWNVSGMARQFIAGRNPDDVMATLRKRRAQKIGFTVDLLGEAVVSEADADKYAARYLDLLERLAQETNCAVFTNESSRSGRRNCASRPQAQAVSASRARTWGVYQLRHGKLRAQKYDS